MEISCPSGHRSQVTSEQVGTKVRCPTCQQAFVVSGDPAAPPLPSGGAVPEPRPASASPASRLGSWRLDDLDVLYYCRPVAQLLLLLGMILALGARGCDSIGNRSVARAVSKSELEKAQWNDKWTSRRQTIDERERAINDKDTRSDADQEELVRLRDERAQLTKDMEQERQQLQTGDWREMEIESRDAAAENLMAGFWREVFFVLGTILFSIGLLAIGFTGDGAQRWICMVLLAIIVFSLYIGGVGWISSVSGLLR